MINLEQIQALEKKINNAVELISILKRENTALKRTIESSQKRVQDLENLVNQFKNEQFEIEKGILNALTKLDELEDDITDSSIQYKDSQVEGEKAKEKKNEKSEPESEQPELVEKDDDSNTLIEESFEKNEEEQTGITLKKTETDNDSESSNEDDGVNELDIF